MTSSPAPGLAVVVDDTALIALGAGNQVMSRLVARAQPGRLVLAPAMCVAAAVSRRPRLGDHVGGLLAISIVDLGFAGANTVGSLVADGADWRRAHAVATARPSLEWPAGLPVVTADPDAYTGHRLQVIDLS